MQKSFRPTSPIHCLYKTILVTAATAFFVDSINKSVYSSFDRNRVERRHNKLYHDGSNRFVQHNDHHEVRIRIRSNNHTIIDCGDNDNATACYAGIDNSCVSDNDDDNNNNFGSHTEFRYT